MTDMCVQFSEPKELIDNEVTVNVYTDYFNFRPHTKTVRSISVKWSYKNWDFILDEHGVGEHLLKKKTFVDQNAIIQILTWVTLSFLTWHYSKKYVKAPPQKFQLWVTNKVEIRNKFKQLILNSLGIISVSNHPNFNSGFVSPKQCQGRLWRPGHRHAALRTDQGLRHGMQALVWLVS